jgi:hypothetical protein
MIPALLIFCTRGEETAEKHLYRLSDLEGESSLPRERGASVRWLWLWEDHRRWRTLHEAQAAGRLLPLERSCVLPGLCAVCGSKTELRSVASGIPTVAMGAS